MKLWKIFVLVLAICLLGTCLAACGDEAETTLADSCADPETNDPETTAPCTHPDMTEQVLVAATCETGGKIEMKCEECGYMEEIVTDFAHEDSQNYNATLGVNESVCALCGDNSVVVSAGKRIKLSAFCEGELSFSLVAPSADAALEVLVDGESIGEVVFDENGKATVAVEDMEKGAHTIAFVNGGTKDVRIKNEKIDGYFNRPGAVLLELESRMGQEYGSFNIFVQTSDPSGDYYIRYPMKYEYRPETNNFTATLANVKNYRIYGAQLVKVTEVGDYKVKYEQITSVLSIGEFSLALLQASTYDEYLAEGAKAVQSKPGEVLDFIGGYHGDEWLSEVTLFADDEEIVLSKASSAVIPCSTLSFTQVTTMYAWGTSNGNSHGLPVANHTQNFVFDSAGVHDEQTLEWLRGDFKIGVGYMPMFPMLRGDVGDRYIDTMRGYDENGKLLEEYKMSSEAVTRETAVIMRDDCAMYEYTGSKGISAKVSFRKLNDEVDLCSSYVALRVEAAKDNKLYVSIGSAQNGFTPAEGEVWKVDTSFMIDYIEPIA